jgi:hypothetical protein
MRRPAMVALLALLRAPALQAEPAAPPRPEGQVPGGAPAGPVRPGAPLWVIPRFFEVGREVALHPGAEPIDTTRWVGQALGRDETHRQRDLTATADDVWRIFTYPEVTPGSGTPRRYALFLPRGRPGSANGRTVAYWEPSADAFNFGVEGSRTFGNLAVSGPGRTDPVIRPLAREIQPTGAGVNVQAYELRYAIGGTGDVLWEQKGLIPGLPVSFERFRLETRARAATNPWGSLVDRDPADAASGPGPAALTIGLIPGDAPAWVHLESFAVAGYRVLLATDVHGAHYFLAAPLSLAPTWYFGNVASDLVVDAVVPALQARAASPPAGAPDPSTSTSPGSQAVAALFLPSVVAGTVLSGRVGGKDELAGYLPRATAFLAAHDAALADLRARGGEGLHFLRHYSHTFLETHRSRFDPRALTAVPYGDHLHPINAPESARGIRHGSDQARALLGLLSYQRKTGDPSVVEAIWGLTEASMEAMTPWGAVFRSRFDQMLVAEEVDSDSGRADAFIDNGGVAVSFNHQRLVVRSGAPRAAGATWGAFSMVLGAQAESVEGGDYSFAVDAGSIPETVRGDRESLEVARLFTRRDGTLRVRETATLSRGVPAARVHEEIENRGEVPRFLAEVRMTIGDFLHYGDGPTEASQNRYGLSAVVEGTRQPVGLWMEGLREPLWGDTFGPGWVDLTEIYRRHRPRFVVVYAHGKAEAYYLPQAADQLLVHNAATRPPGVDGYRGWTALQVRHRVGRMLSPGATYRSPSVYTYLMRAPLFSVDSDTVPDVLQSLLPLWTDLVEASRHHRSLASLRADFDARPDREQAGRLARLLHTALEPDDTSIALQAAWMAAADRMADLAAGASNPDERRELERRTLLVRENALRGAHDSLTTLTELRGRSDLMPSFGLGSNYGFHLLVFDWAYRMTGDARFRVALLSLADQISTPEARGGLQVADASKPNFGGFILNERARAQGSNNLDDQGIKLWALRVAYERTGRARYRRSAELFIDHWIKVRADDHQFFGITRLFDRYTRTGAEQQMTSLGHNSLLIGLAAWADLHPMAARLRAEGMKNLTERHPVDAIGTTGALEGSTSCGSNRVQFGTGTEVGGTFLLAMTFDPAWLRGRWPARPGRWRPSRTSAVESAKGKPAWLRPPHVPGG